MNEYILPSILSAILLVLIVSLGCSTTGQRTAYNSIFTVQQTASVAVDGYYDLVIKGIVPTNNLPQVALRYNQLRKACLVAATTAEAGTNAIAPAALTAELTSLTAFILSLESK